MSEAKHTPGPWLIADASFVYALNDSGYNRFWTNVTGGDLRKGESTSKVETEANARLIAAAPDLLDALQSIIEDIDSEFGTDCDYNKARAAIAKATGGSA